MPAKTVKKTPDEISWKSLQALSSTFEQRLERLSPIECATVLILGNVLMKFSDPKGFAALSRRPSIVQDNARRYQDIMRGILSTARPDIIEAAALMTGNSKRYSICHLCALDFVLLCFAGGFRPSILGRLKGPWRELHRRSSPANAGITFIRAFERSRNIQALPFKPDRTPYTNAELTQMFFLPPFCVADGTAST